MRTVDVDEALELLQRAVDEKGENFVYQRSPKAGGCLYVHDDVPGCIVGHVLHYLGVPLDAMSTVEGKWINQADVTWLLIGCGISLTYKALRILIEAQFIQDGGRPWGDALAAARRVAMDLGVEA